MTSIRFPLRVDSSARFLVDQDGKPFLLVGDAAWSLFVGTSKADARYYFRNRRQHGFNAALVNLIEHKYAEHAPNNYYGIPPFTDRIFASPNEPYFAFVDEVVRNAAKEGIALFIAPLYLGAQCGDYGWCAEAKAASLGDMEAWGRYIGQRYRSYPNIVWVLGGDADPSPVKSKILAMAGGIRAEDPGALFTAHNAPEQMAVAPWSGSGLSIINNVYTYLPAVYQPVLDAYFYRPSVPVFLIEAAYEHEHGVTEQQLRAQLYYTMLSGGFGAFFGNCPIWGFRYTDKACPNRHWKDELDGPGSRNMAHFQKFFKSRHWHTLIPDTDHNVVIAGYGTSGQPDYAVAAYASDGSFITAYLPSQRPITIKSQALKGDTLVASWYDPSLGVMIPIGMYPSPGQYEFVPPASGDWVLVLDGVTSSMPTSP